MRTFAIAVMIAGLIVSSALTVELAAGHGNKRHANSTAYAPGCGDSGITASGTKPHRRTAAMLEGTVPLGTKIEIVGKQRGPGGLRRWIVEDHIGHSSELDFWVSSCGKANAWGRRNVHWRRGWSK